MKVLHITTNFPTAKHPTFGIFMQEQMNSLVQEGVECNVFFSNGKEYGKKQHLKSVFEIRKILSENKYDLIHCHHVISALILILSGKAFVNKCIVSYQNDPKFEFGMIIFRLVYLIFNKVIIKNTSDLLKLKKVVYLPNGTNEIFFKPMNRFECREELGLNPDSIYILFMDSNKGKRTQKRKDRFDATLEVIKNTYSKGEVRALELYNINRNEIPKYICASNLHLVTSDFEGSPNSVKECLCCNIPVVSTDVGNVKEMISDIPGCYVSETFNVQELASFSLKSLLVSDFHGRELFLNKGYSIQSVAKKLKNVYSVILN